MSRNRFAPFEFALVIGIAFGWPILGSVLDLLYGKTVGEAGARQAFTDSYLYGVVMSELIAFPVIVALLHFRGWRPQDFPLGISPAATALGAAMFAAAWIVDWIANATLVQLFSTLGPALETLSAYRPTEPPSLVAIYLVSVINPVFEEVIVCGYVIPAIAGRFGQTAAINTSVIIRVSYHLYQGVAALPFHALYGLMQAYLYARFGRLWPLIVSHALLDFVALMLLV